MSRLRIYYYNGGDMLDLVRMQKEKMELAVGAEELSCHGIRKSERNKNGEVGKYVEALAHTLPYRQVKKIAALKSHIWNL